MVEKRLLLAAMAALALMRIFPKVQIDSYEALSFGFAIDFVHKEPLDKEFLRLFRDVLDLFLNENPKPYPMTMMADNAAQLLKSQKQELLAKKISGKALIELVKVGDIALPAPHVDLGRPVYQLLNITKVPGGLWRLEAAVFDTKEGLREFLKLYADKSAFDPFHLACRESLVTKEGLWLEKGIALLEKIRHQEELFWQKRGFERVFGALELPPKALLWAPVLDNSLNVNMLGVKSPRLWAVDRTRTITEEEVFLPTKALQIPYCQGKGTIFVQDPLGASYETARVVSSGAAIEASLFASPLQVLALLLQKTRGRMQEAESLQKEMFEFSR
jgi:hypothetical protein